METCWKLPACSLENDNATLDWSSSDSSISSSFVSKSTLSCPVRMKFREPTDFADSIVQTQVTPFNIPSDEFRGVIDAMKWNINGPRYWEWPQPGPEDDIDRCRSVCVDENGDLVELKRRLCVNLQHQLPENRIYPLLSATFRVIPSAIIFHQDPATGQWEEFVWIRFQNCGNLTRRLHLTQPRNPIAFSAVWAENKNVVPPGLYVHLLVRYHSAAANRDRDHPIRRDEILVRVEDDGGILLPILATPQEPPILELEEFTIGSSFVGRELSRVFKIQNHGGLGRFWIISAAEFMHERFEEICVPEESAPNEMTDSTQMAASDDRINESGAHAEEMQADANLDEQIDCSPDLEKIDAELEADQIQTANEDIEIQPFLESDLGEEDRQEIGGEDELITSYVLPPPNTPCENKSRDVLSIPPFQLFPACFALATEQEIKVKLTFKPNESGVFHQKIAILCDNGEVRWVMVKGQGIEPATQRLIKLEVDDFRPNDSDTHVDWGTISPYEPFKKTLKITNGCSLPVYFFWHIFPGYTKHVKQPSREISLGEDEIPGERGEYEHQSAYIPGFQLEIHPTEGLLRGCAEIECDVSGIGLPQIGTYGCRICLSIAQLSQDSIVVLGSMTPEELDCEISRQMQLGDITTTTTQHPTDRFSLHAHLNLPKFKIPSMELDEEENMTQEFTVGIECVPIQFQFDPDSLEVTGYQLTQQKHQIKVTNNSHHPMTFSLISHYSEVVSIRVCPGILKVSPKSEKSFQITFRFQQVGEIQSELKGFLELPYKKIQITIPFRVISEAIRCDEVVEPETVITEPLVEEAGEIESIVELPTISKTQEDTPRKKSIGIVSGRVGTRRSRKKSSLMKSINEI